MPLNSRVSSGRFTFASPRSRQSAVVKSFGRRQASESPRGTNPRCAGRGLWGFDVLAVPGWTAVKCAALHRMCIARAFPGDHGRNPRPLVGHFGDRGRDQRARRRGRGDGRAGCRLPKRHGDDMAWEQTVPGHDGVPVAVGARGGARGCIQRSKVSMMRMRPPQQGHGGS